MPWWRRGKDKRGRKDRDEDEEDEWGTTPLSPDMVAPLGFNLFIRELNRALSELFGEDSEVKGFSVTVGPDGVPRLKEFEREDKVLDIIDLGDRVEVIAEVKASSINEVRIKASGRRVFIAIPSRGIRLSSKLPSSIHGEPVRISLRNGVLDIVFRKK